MGGKNLVVVEAASVPECRHAERWRILSFNFKYRNGINNTAQLNEGCIFRQKGLVSVHALVCVHALVMCMCPNIVEEQHLDLGCPF